MLLAGVMRCSSEQTQVTELSTTTLMLVRTRNRMHPVTTFTKLPQGSSARSQTTRQVGKRPRIGRNATSGNKRSRTKTLRLEMMRDQVDGDGWIDTSAGNWWWFWRGLAREAFPAPGRKARGSRKLSEKRSRLARSFEGKRPEELERANNKVIESFVVLPGQAEADEAEGPALGSS